MTRAALELLEGLAPFVEDELRRTQPHVAIVAVEPTEIRVETEDPSALLELRTVVAAYRSIELDVRRPRALLSPDTLRQCTGAIDAVRRAAKPARFASFRLSAAGSDSPELHRFREAIEQHTGLTDDPEHGDMLLRLRRSRWGAAGWELLVRLTPRPLSARPWRVANYPGALNASIAAAMVDSTDPSPDDEVVDLMCGSGTLLIERLARGAPRRLVACDISPEALDAARANQRAAKFRGKVEYVLADARTLDEHVRGVNKLLVNLPWGELVGQHVTNEVLYPAVLDAAQRMARDDAVFAVLTHDIRRFEQALDQAGGWAVRRSWRVFQKGHRPKLYNLRRDG
jgi:tRNA (guanine6-N2)-methyltransferase